MSGSFYTAVESKPRHTAKAHRSSGTLRGRMVVTGGPVAAALLILLPAPRPDSVRRS
jgi:hypothetical protein